MNTTSPSSYSSDRARLALLVAVLDGECDARVHELLCTDEPHLAVRVAHRLAHDLVDGVDKHDHPEMRADLVAELLELAGRPDDQDA